MFDAEQNQAEARDESGKEDRQGAPPPAEQASRRRRILPLRKPVVLFCTALLLAGVAATVWMYRKRRSYLDSSNSPPPPRPYVDAPFITTPQDIVEKMLELAQVTKDDVVYDLGCGDGRIVITAAKKYGCRAWGFDNDPERVRESRENAKAQGVDHLVTIEQRDIFTLDLSPADVVTLYLLPRLNVRLLPQLKKLKPGSRIVSHQWDIEGVKQQKRVELISTEDHREHTIYVWVTPLEKAPTKGNMARADGNTEDR